MGRVQLDRCAPGYKISGGDAPNSERRELTAAPWNTVAVRDAVLCWLFVGDDRAKHAVIC